MGKDMFRIGVDVGGTNIAIGLVDEAYNIVVKTSIKTSEASEPEQMIDAIALTIKKILVDKELSESDIEAIGVGVPGTAELTTGKIMYANNLGFEEVPFLPKLKEALGENLGSRTFFDNDANVAAIGEYITGGYDVDNFMMVTLGTGIGGGIIINRKLLRGVNFAAAEFGHMTINLDGVDCNCGRKGCFEDYASATALMNQAKEAMEKDVDKESLLWKLCGKAENADGEKFFEAVRQKDRLALEVLDGFTTYLSEGITNLINILQPDVLVLSGGITRAADLFLDDLKKKVAKGIYSRTSEKNTEIMLAHGISDAGDVGIIGAALINRG
jgi:glucokinase